MSLKNKHHSQAGQLQEEKIFLHIENLTKRFHINGSDLLVLKDICFSVKRGEFICLLGQSGCGKSTLLKLLAGFSTPCSGKILLKGKQILKPGPDRCVVFQEDALFPWLTVEENIRFGLNISKTGKRQINHLVDQFLDLVGLKPFKNYLPQEISGGMKQRVALARVLVLQPSILLMDEPFVALDAQNRKKMQNLVLSLWQMFAHTIIFVTHDVREALALSDRIVLMNKDPGSIKKQIRINLKRPRNPEAANFIEYYKKLNTILEA